MKQNKYVSLLAASILFTSPVQGIGIGDVSAALTLGTQDSISQTACIALTTTSETGQFSSSKTNWNPTNVLTMNKGTSNRSFYYKDSTEGEYAITAVFALKPASVTESCAAWPQSKWGSILRATQHIAVGEGGAEISATNSNTQTVAASSSSSASARPGALTVKVTSQPVVAVGAGSYFSGSATNSGGTTGLDTRYIWNFGDGSIQEGSNVFHTYTYPGTYNVLLSVASGERAGIGRVVVEAVSAKIGMQRQSDGSVSISNYSPEELNIGLWNISSGMSSFQIPQDTFLPSKQSIRFSASVMHMVAGGDVVLKYPNNFPVSLVNQAQETAPASSQSPEILAAVSAAQPLARVSQSEAAPVDSKEFLEEPEEEGVLWPYVLGALGLILMGVGIFFKRKPMKKVTKRVVREFDIKS